MVDLSATHTNTALGPVVLAFHGTRHPDGEPTVRAIASLVADALGGSDVRVGWLDIHPELLAEQLPGLGPATVVPCLLAAGHHVQHDVPAAADASPHPVRVTEHLADRALPAVADRIAEAGGPGDAVVLAAIGSRIESAQAEVVAAAERLTELVGVPVRPAFIFGGTPKVADVVAGLRADGKRDILIAPYAISPGLFEKRLTGLGTRIAAPIGTHPALIDAVAGLAEDISASARSPQSHVTAR